MSDEPEEAPPTVPMQAKCTKCQTHRVWMGDPPALDCSEGGRCRLVGTPMIGAAMTVVVNAPGPDEHVEVGRDASTGLVVITCSCQHEASGADDEEAEKRQAEHRVDSMVKAGTIPEKGAFL